MFGIIPLRSSSSLSPPPLIFYAPKTSNFTSKEKRPPPYSLKPLLTLPDIIKNLNNILQPHPPRKFISPHNLTQSLYDFVVTDRGGSCGFRTYCGFAPGDAGGGPSLVTDVVEGTGTGGLPLWGGGGGLERGEVSGEEPAASEANREAKIS